MMSSGPNLTKVAQMLRDTAAQLEHEELITKEAAPQPEPPVVEYLDSHQVLNFLKFFG